MIRMKNNKKTINQDEGRQAINWDEDEFETDSLSDQTEESEEEKESPKKNLKNGYTQI